MPHDPSAKPRPTGAGVPPRAARAQMQVLRSLTTDKGRRASGLFLVEGVRLCEELAQSALTPETVVAAEARWSDARVRAAADALAARGATLRIAPAWEVERISDTVHGQGLVAAARAPECAFDPARLAETARVLALDRVSDPGNLGAILRTAAWFGVAAVILGDGCADPLNPKVVRAAMGGLFHLTVLRRAALGPLLDTLRERHGFHVFAADATGTPDWRNWARPPRAALLLGSEAHGLSPDLTRRAEAVYSVPRLGHGESLNVGVTAGIFLSALAAPDGA